MSIFDDATEPLIKLKRPPPRVAPALDMRQATQLAHDLQGKQGRLRRCR